MEVTRDNLEIVMRRLDSENSWRKYQVNYPDSDQGNFQIRKFSIPPWDKMRRRLILTEGINRDPGSGDFTKLQEIIPGAGSEGTDLKRVWMSDTHAEILEHTPVLNKFYQAQHVKHRRVLINGLGLGLVVHAALTFDSIVHLDVVEHNEDIIKLVGPYLTADPRVTIHLADAYEIHWPSGARWDLAWHDIWPDINDENLPGMDRLLAKYKTRVAWQGCWQRQGCLAMARIFQQLKNKTLSPERAWQLFGGKGWLE
jgi:hypothetical protein